MSDSQQNGNGLTTERFPALPADQSAHEAEQALLGQWREEGLFQRVQSARAGAPPFVFFEGPPTANGRPGIHHVFARTIKDLFCRHRAMQGFYVPRKAGWDTHGLPVEIEVEKQLGISGKQDIERIGVEKFNQLCRESVFKYRADWQRMSERIAFWLDYDDAYATYTNDYVESVWWALSTLHERGLLYLGHKILPYCPRCGTSLSSHEVAQGYKDVTDPSVYIALDIVPQDSGAGATRRRLLVWTTTPWTLVSNVALAVSPTIDYVELRKRGGKTDETIILAEARAGAVLGEDYRERWDAVATLGGASLAGTRYKRPLDWVAFEDGAHEIIVAESFVSAEDGSGIVHMAPAFGADDYAAGRRHGLAFLQPVTGRGEFEAGIPVVGGKFVKEADAAIVEELRARGVLWKAGKLAHSYPHCWRCDTPLLYYARTSWFIRTTSYRDAMLTRNARVDWHPPEIGEGRFGEWLVNNIDWAISRDRYWGTPLPLWVCDRDPQHVEAIGGYEQLAKRWGKPLPADFDPHKPYIDRYTWKCAACEGTMSRVSEVVDAWFDSGSMPFAQWHYPFENRDMVARYYPGDFIAEGQDQTRGWFYSLLAIATGLGDALPNNLLEHEAKENEGVDVAPYRAVVVNGVLLDAKGEKMSKRLGNIVNPDDLLPVHGADALRISLIAASQVWMPRNFDEAAIRESAGRFLVTLRNVYSGIFALYANFGWEPGGADLAPAGRPLIDRWVLARLATVERETDALLERYESMLALRGLMEFFVDDVSNWYVRLNRHRFYDVEAPDNRAAFATLHEVLVVTCRLLAPFAPFVSDWIHRELTQKSVHLSAYVRTNAVSPDIFLERGMESLRKLATLGRAAREEAGVRVRQPLARMVCVVPDAVADAVRQLAPLLKSELNVKSVEFASSADSLVRLEAKPNFRSMGKKFGKSTPAAAQSVTELGGDALREFERGSPLFISIGGESHALDAEDLTIIRRASGELVVKEEGEYFAAIDASVTPELRAEGLARELVSRVQRMRKESGFAVSDRISVAVWGDPELEGAVEAHREWIAEEVLARELAIGGSGSRNAAKEVDLDGVAAHVALKRVG
ncbi:MAG TPA: isoleucine--tRNA ligase [Gemmatimonadaceae bacterium]|nr:isoleucine--tRNA ligase [Gemmatimonadaceae bacterium]